jgi:hypothetical protein
MTTRTWPQGSAPAGWTEPVPAVEVVPAARPGISFVDGAVLGLIALVVVLVSLPRLRHFALRENETDAIRALRLFSEDALAHPDALAKWNLADLLSASSVHRARLEDVEVLEDGRLRCHGYLFAAALGSSGRPWILAWPWEHGRTGLAAFAIEPGGDLLGSLNEDGRFSGPDDPPPAGSDAAADPHWIAIGKE